MVKLNFKTAKPLQPKASSNIETKKQEAVESAPPAQEEPELQYVDEGEDQIEFIEESEKETSFESAEEKTRTTPASSAKFKFKDNVLDDLDDSGFDSSGGGGKKAVFIILGIILLLALLGGGGFAVYQYTDLFKDTTPVGKKSPAVTKEPVPQTVDRPETTPPPPSPLLKQWQQNLGNNLFILNHLQQIISNKSEFIRFSLIVAAPDEITLTILSDSRDKIAGFKDQLNKNLPSLNFRTISTQEKTVNRSRLTFADLRSNVPAKLITSASKNIRQGAPSDNFNQAITNLSRKHQVTMNQITSGKSIQVNNQQARYFYLTLSGSSTNILKFLQEMINDYPATQINKIALNPTNLITYSENNLSVRINLLLFYPI